MFFATPVIRTVARMRHALDQAPMTWPRRSVLNLFILTIMLEPEPVVQEEHRFSRPRMRYPNRDSPT